MAAKRTLKSNLRTIANIIVTYKGAHRGERPTCEQVAAETKGVFKNGQDLGTWLAGAVTRMDSPDNKKKGTNLHKAAQNVLKALQEKSPATDFVVQGGNDQQFEDMATLEL